MADRPRPGGRRPRREQTNEEVLFELLVQIADDLRAIKRFAYWVFGLWVLGAVLIFVVTLSG